MRKVPGVSIQWTLYYPMRPRSCERQWNDSGRSHDNDNMTNIVLSDYIL